MASVSKNTHQGRNLTPEATTAGGVASDIVSAKIAAKIVDMPVSYRKTYQRAMTGKSLRAAVNAFCAECVCWQKEEVRLCTSLACPLYCYRPYRDE